MNDKEQVTAMKLFHSPLSPFVRKVMVVLMETGLTAEIVSVTGSPVNPGTLPVDVNPLGKIPTLVTDEGRPLFDSRVICRYLDDLAGAGLYGDGATLWDVLTGEALADGVMEAAVLLTYEARLRPEELRFAPWVEGQWAKIARALDAAEGQMALLSGPLNMAQIGLACALAYLDLRHHARDWRNGRPRLTEWEAGFARRPSMQATRPPAP